VTGDLTAGELAAVEALLAARRSGVKLPALPAGAEPASEASAYAVQGAVLHRLGQPVAGWKVSAVAGQPHGYAPMPADVVLPGPARFSLGVMRPLGIEAEIAFVMARDLDVAPGSTIDAETFAAHVAGACAAIELVESRFAVPAAQPRLAAWADAMSHGAFAFGPVEPDWRGLDPATIAVRLSIDGVIVVAREGGNPAIPPLEAATWLAARLNARGLPLRAGQVVTTGSYTGLTPMRAGETAVAEFAGLGPVSLGLVP